MRQLSNKRYVSSSCEKHHGMVVLRKIFSSFPVLHRPRTHQPFPVAVKERYFLPRPSRSRSGKLFVGVVQVTLCKNSEILCHTVYVVVKHLYGN
jgi:hypothetical protein